MIAAMLLSHQDPEVGGVMLIVVVVSVLEFPSAADVTAVGSAASSKYRLHAGGVPELSL